MLRLILAVFGVAGVSLAANLFGYDPALTLGIFIFTLTFVFAAVLVPLVTLLKRTSVSMQSQSSKSPGSC